jgi:colicin import membrane protein
MIPTGRRYPGPEGMFALSFVCHLAIVAFIIWSGSSAVFHPSEEPVTYVDVVTLPVASPQAGTPAPAEEKSAPAAAAPAPVRPPAPAMALPAAKPKAKLPPPVKGKAEKPAPPVEDAREFSQRLEKLQRQAEDKRLADTLARLKKGGGKAVGMPGAKGTQAGSDYSSYIQSRLKDAFKDVIASTTSTPQVLVRITIGIDGRITGYRVEKKSGDPVFDDSVSRAVTMAGRNFKPPPNGVPFERVFRFKPEGVGLP